MIVRRTEDGALKCALRDLRREEWRAEDSVSHVRRRYLSRWPIQAHRRICANVQLLILVILAVEVMYSVVVEVVNERSENFWSFAYRSTLWEPGS